MKGATFVKILAFIAGAAILAATAHVTITTYAGGYSNPYAALVITIGGTIYRFAYHAPDPAAYFILSLVIAIAMGGFALNLFGLDTASGFTRYHLLPLPGWKILLAKDAAFMTVLLILVAPLHLLGGASAGLIALAFGHHDSTRHFAAQARWRFTGQARMPSILVQGLLMTATASLVAHTSALFLIPCFLAYSGSLWYFGRELAYPAD